MFIFIQKVKKNKSIKNNIKIYFLYYYLSIIYIFINYL